MMWRPGLVASVALVLVATAIVAPVAAWVTPQLGGSLSRVNSSASEFGVTFTETGLPSGNSWSVTLSGTIEYSTTSTITFAEPDGSFSFTVGSVPGFAATPSAGNITVSGSSVGQSIQFAPPVTDYTVTFSQTGLPGGLVWSVTLNGSLRSTNTSASIVFTEPNGSYPFVVGAIPGCTAVPVSGEITVNAAAADQPIAFNCGDPPYAVTFAESGLTGGTSWSVTMNGTLVSSTSNSIVFHVSNGSYLFLVSPVPGFSTNPEGNVTVTGSPVTVPILFTPNSTGTSNCTSYTWQVGNYSFNGDCRGLFEINLRSFNAITGYTFENSTFDVGSIAEVNSAGNLVALSVMGYESTGSISEVTQGNEANVTDSIVANVTTVIGLNASSGNPNGQIPTWSPNDAPGNLGPTIWGSGAQVLGTINLVIVFHFVVGSHASDRVEFDLRMSGWPWVNPADSLGVEIGATAEQQTYFVYTASNDTIAQDWTSNGTVASSLVFGASANATAGGVNSTLGVSDAVGLYPSGTAPDIAFALLSFHGAGGYSALTYDPWIVFGPTPATVRVPVGPASTGGATLPLVAVGGIAIATALLGLTAYRLRRGRAEEGLRSLA